MASSGKRKKWEDHYSRKAKKDKFAARSVYKLEEIQKKHRIIKKGDKIIDLGCTPGSWLQYAAGLTGNSGLVVGIDIKPMTINMPANTRYVNADILQMDEAQITSIGNDFNLVMSDMAPATTGQKHVDATRSFDLCRAALSLAERTLKPGGSFICKIFQGELFQEFSESVKKSFKQHKIFKPQSSRKASKEIYIIGIGKK
jgi:23S rRNA (uridine2552-2'-O)-methyltransferase